MQEEKRTLANHLIININQWNLHILLFWIWSICLLIASAAAIEGADAVAAVKAAATAVVVFKEAVAYK